MRWLPLLVLALFLLGCGTTGPAETTAPDTPKGVSLSPKSFSAEDFTDFFKKAKEAGSFVTWAGDWQQMNDRSGAPSVVLQLARQHGLTPIIVVSPFEQSTGEFIRPLTDDQLTVYASDAAAFAKEHQPPYLGVGIEVNTFKLHNEANFARFVKLYKATYDAVKRASPDTQVFTVFQLEQMQGRNDGLFGGENHEPQWELLDRFANDLAVFTTYPGLVYKDPSDIPPDYYDEIRKHTSLPVAFIESGWPSASIPGWESSDEEQARFVTALFGRTRALDPAFVIWSFLYPVKTFAPFDAMSLFNADGTPKSAWPVWKGQ